jgi:hypothetical protein
MAALLGKRLGLPARNDLPPGDPTKVEEISDAFVIEGLE